MPKKKTFQTGYQVTYSTITGVAEISGKYWSLPASDSGSFVLDTVTEKK